MRMADKIELINRGFFNPESPPQRAESLGDGRRRFVVVNWPTVRPALEALKEMPWHQLHPDWNIYLDDLRHPIGRAMELTAAETGRYQNLVEVTVSQIGEAMRVLSSMHPVTSGGEVVVTLQASDLTALFGAVEHIRRTTELAAIDDAITIGSFRSGSIDVVLTAGKASMLALQFAILLATGWKGLGVPEKVRTLRRYLERNRPDEPVDDESLRESVLADARDTFWQEAENTLRRAVEQAGKNVPESQNRINQAAKEIYENAEGASAHWRLPQAVITGLPGGLSVALHLEDPESIGRVVRVLSAPAESLE